MKPTEGAIPACLGPRGSAAEPGWKVPAGAWDTHFHVLGPTSRFPFGRERKYTPPDAALENILALHDKLGIARGFVVHANTHGFDNAVDLDAVARSSGRYVAVVRLDREATAAGCRELHRAGARGVRFAFNPQHGGTLDTNLVEHVLGCVNGLGWFVELHFAGESLPVLAPWIARLPAPVVIDHFGRIDPGPGVEQPQFKLLASLAERDNIWIKITGSDRISRLGPPYADVAPLARRLAEIADDRLLWGSDWPHTGYFDPRRVPDTGVLLDALAAFLPDEELRRKVLVDNPMRLLGHRDATDSLETIP